MFSSNKSALSGCGTAPDILVSLLPMTPQSAHAQPAGSWGLAAQSQQVTLYPDQSGCVSDDVNADEFKVGTNADAVVKVKSSRGPIGSQGVGPWRQRLGLLHFDLSGVKGQIQSANLVFSGWVFVDKDSNGNDFTDWIRPASVSTFILDATTWPASPTWKNKPRTAAPGVASFTLDSTDDAIPVEKSIPITATVASHQSRGWVGLVFNNSQDTFHAWSEMNVPRLELTVSGTSPTPGPTATPKPQADVLSLTTDTSAMCAVGGAAKLVATFKTTGGSPLPRKSVRFSWTLPGSSSLSTTNVTTNARGEALITIAAGDTVGEFDVTATCEGKTKLQTLEVEQAQGQLQLTPQSIVADGKSQFTLALSLAYNKKPVSGHRISWRVVRMLDENGKPVSPDSRGNYPGYGGFVSPTSSAALQTDANGKAVHFYTVGTKVGTVTFEAQDESVWLDDDSQSDDISLYKATRKHPPYRNPSVLRADPFAHLRISLVPSSGAGILFPGSHYVGGKEVP